MYLFMNDEEIQIEVVGKIIEGEKKGFYVLLKEDFNESGGYLILISKDPNFTDAAEGYDSWGEDITALKDIFKGFNWQIIWLG